MMAEMFRENSGPAARARQSSSSTTSKRLIGSRYLFVGALLRVMHRKDNLSEHVTLGDPLRAIAFRPHVGVREEDVPSRGCFLPKPYQADKHIEALSRVFLA